MTVPEDSPDDTGSAAAERPAPPVAPAPAPQPVALDKADPAPAPADPAHPVDPLDPALLDAAALDGDAAAPQPSRGLNRGARVALAVAGLLVVTATSTAVTVAVGKPDTAPRAVAAAPTAAPTASASASPTPTSVPTPSASTPPPPAPKPSSTLHGTVNGDKHGGDLRFFLIPMPDGAESYGSSDGVQLSTDEVSKEFGNADEMPRILKSYGYQDDAAERRYRTADGKQEVEVRMMRFKNRDMAKEFAKGMTFDTGDTFDVDGDGAARGIMMKPEQEAWTGQMLGVSFVGDVEYEVTVYVKGTPDKALLADAMRRQRERLGSGG
ncbi:hypothetical protein [Kitasatospora sp. NPDC094015]|uniref:hypothetical protein n=1 Tax=Kitasatospora sp. NPDC094015 TaxID=3155205 RepID=UPI00332260DC